MTKFASEGTYGISERAEAIREQRASRAQLASSDAVQKLLVVQRADAGRFGERAGLERQLDLQQVGDQLLDARNRSRCERPPSRTPSRTCAA